MPTRRSHPFAQQYCGEVGSLVEIMATSWGVGENMTLMLSRAVSGRQTRDFLTAQYRGMAKMTLRWHNIGMSLPTRYALPEGSLHIACARCTTVAFHRVHNVV
jgi:LSD1 subclass zinc finger protein